MIVAGPLGCLESTTDFCPGPRDSSLDCVGKIAANNRVRTQRAGVGVGLGGGGEAKSVVSRAIQALSIIKCVTSCSHWDVVYCTLTSYTYFNLLDKIYSRRHFEIVLLFSLENRL